MVAEFHRSLPLPDRTYQGQVRREAERLARQWGLSDSLLGRFNLIVAELSSNLIKYATKHAELLVAPVQTEAGPGAEILSIDSGPGMLEPARLLQDGVSTGGSAGEGLGAVRRLATTFDLYSRPEVGTVVLARLTPEAPREVPQLGLVGVPKPGEQAWGDGLRVRRTGTDDYLILALDGLGHGPEASAASRLAEQAFATLPPELAPHEMLQQLHDVLRSTRGAVAAVLRVRPTARTLDYCGVGNLTLRLVTPPDVRSLLSFNGTVGHTLPRTLLTSTLTTQPGQWLIVASDGLQTRWDWTRYPRLQRHHPSVMAAVLYADQRRRTDDSLSFVCQLR